MSSTTGDNKNPQRVAAGLKGVINRSNVSDETRENAQARLEEMGDGAEYASGNNNRGTRSSGNSKNSRDRDEDGSHDDNSREDEIHEHRVLGGYKATLKNPNVSDEAKEHAEQVLKEYE